AGERVRVARDSLTTVNTARVSTLCPTNPLSIHNDHVNAGLVGELDLIEKNAARVAITRDHDTDHGRVSAQNLPELSEDLSRIDRLAFDRARDDQVEVLDVIRRAVEARELDGFFG